MSNSQQGYDWTRSFVFLEETGERFEVVGLTANLNSKPNEVECSDKERIVKFCSHEFCISHLRDTGKCGITE